MNKFTWKTILDAVNFPDDLNSKIELLEIKTNEFITNCFLNKDVDIEVVLPKQIFDYRITEKLINNNEYFSQAKCDSNLPYNLILIQDKYYIGELHLVNLVLEDENKHTSMIQGDPYPCGSSFERDHTNSISNEKSDIYEGKELISDFKLKYIPNCDKINGKITISKSFYQYSFKINYGWSLGNNNPQSVYFGRGDNILIENIELRKDILRIFWNEVPEKHYISISYNYLDEENLYKHQDFE